MYASQVCVINSPNDVWRNNGCENPEDDHYHHDLDKRKPMLMSELFAAHSDCSRKTRQPHRLADVDYQSDEQSVYHP